MYEFIASGLRPAEPISSYLQGVDARQARESQAIQDRNNAVIAQGNELKLKSAQKQVQAEESWAQLPRDQQGQIDPQARHQFASQYPEYSDTRYKSDAAQRQDQIKGVADQLNLAATMYKNASTPESAEEVRAFAKDSLGIELGPYNQAVYGEFGRLASEIGQQYQGLLQDRAAFAAKGDWGAVQLLDEQISAIGEKGKAELALTQAQAREKNALAAAAANKPATSQPLVQFLDDQGQAVWGTREQALGKKPVPPAISLRDQLEKDKVDDAKSRVTGNLDALNDYYTEYSALGAAVDTRNTKAENVSAYARSTGVGQLSGKVFGTEEQSIRNKVNQMRPLLLQEIRQASQMGARGLDSNKEMEFYLQAATDPNRDRQANMAALNVLSNAYGLGTKYGEGDETQITEMHNEFLSSLPLVDSDEAYKALKPGAEYRDIAGNRGKKK